MRYLLPALILAALVGTLALALIPDTPKPAPKPSPLVMSIADIWVEPIQSGNHPPDTPIPDFTRPLITPVLARCTDMDSNFDGFSTAQRCISII